MINQKLYEQYNPWWQNQGIPADFQFATKRKLFDQLVPEFKNKKIISIVGLRRVGKSVLIYQLIEHVLAQKINPQRIFYLKTDDPLLEIQKNIISDAVDFYEDAIAQKDLSKSSHTVFFFLDEVQKVEKWGEYLKRYYDLGYNIKFFITGSSSIQMIKTSKESLAGRNKEYILPPLSFKEAVNWQKKDKKIKAISQDKIFSHQVWSSILKQANQQLKLKTREFGFLLNKYLSKGGFPELYFNKEDPYNYIKNQIVDRVIKRDIPEVTGIKNSTLLQQVLILIAKESGNIFSLREISRKLGINFETVASYLFYLEESFLINIFRKYSRGGYSQAKTRPKIHISDVGILSAASGLREEVWRNPGIAGRTIEGIVANNLKFNFSDTNLFFWRDKQGEIDLVLERGGKKLPIEVKYQKNVLKNRFTSLERFREKYNTEFSLIITKEDLKIGKDKIFIPFWMFLLVI